MTKFFLSALPILFLFISQYIFAALSGDYALETGYRTQSDDSFSQFHEEVVESEYIIQVPVYVAEVDAPLTLESLSRLNSNNGYIQIIESSSSKSSLVSELLQIKRTSSLKSLGEVVSDDSTVNWFAANRTKALSKTSSFGAFFTIAEAPTESNSTSGSSAQIISIPNKLKQILENNLILGSLLDNLETDDIFSFLSTNSSVQRLLNNYGKTVFRENFPLFDGLSDSILALKELTKLLKDPELKFVDWLNFNFPIVNPAINLASFLNYRLETAKKANEIFPLVNLIEFLRPSGWHEYFETLPGPLNLFFPENNVKIYEIKDKLLSIIMKASHYGCLRILKALKDDILKIFPDFGPVLILEFFILGREERQGITWSPLQRSVHAQNSKTANFLFYTLTSNKKILETFHKTILNSKSTSKTEEIPSFIERTFFPSLTNQKICKILRKRILNFEGNEGIRAIHFAISKSKQSEILKFFLSLETEFNGPISFEDFSIYLQLAFASKSLNSLRQLRSLMSNERIPIELAIKFDWSIGLKEYSKFDNFKDFLLRYNNLFHLISLNNSVDILKYLCTEIFNQLEIFQFIEQVDSKLRKPAEVALEAGNWDILIILNKFGVKFDKKFLIKILNKNAPLLNNFLTDQHSKEMFSYHFINYESSVTLLEWSILSGNHQAFSWFLDNLPIDIWKRFDGAGNTPIHLAIIVGNCEALKKLLDHDPTLINIQNFNGETPSRIAHRIRDKTRTCEKVFLMDQIMQILIENKNI